MIRALATLAAALALVSAAGAGELPVGVDIGTGAVNGKQVLGKTVPQVVALFGKPDSYLSTKNLTYIRYGPPLTFSLLVLFRAQGTKLVAKATVFQSPALVEVRLGRVLTSRPPAIQRAVRAAYGASFRLVEPYRCSGGGECSGRFDSPAGGRHVTFGLAAGHPFLNLWRD